MHHLKVTSKEGGHADDIAIELDGKPLSLVQSCNIVLEAGVLSPVVTLSMYAQVDIDLEKADTKQVILKIKEKMDAVKK